MEDFRVNQYINKAEDFAQPILLHLRDWVHQICPDVHETLKWGFPHFMYKNQILCSMASFTSHCAFTFWLGSLMEDSHGLFITTGKDKAMGQLGKICSLKDLPKNQVLAEYLMQAMQLIDAGLALPKKPKKSIEILSPIKELQTALDKNPDANAFFNSLSQSYKNEYIRWVAEAKQDSTRIRRIENAILWLKQGKKRDWKYMK